MFATNICPHCSQEFDRLAKHISGAHPEEFIKQDRLVLKYYQEEGLSAQAIADRPDVMYSGKTSINRVLRKHLTPEQLEEGRRRHIGEHVAAEYAAGNRDWVTEINVARVQSEEGRQKNSEGLKLAYAEGRKVSWQFTATPEELAAAYHKSSATLAAKAEAGELKTLLKSGEENPFWIDGRSADARPYRQQKDFNRKERNKIKARADHKCECCGISEAELKTVRDATQHPRMFLECDHKVPIFAGGVKDWEANGQALCSDCHLKKSILEHKQMLNLMSGDILGNLLKISHTTISQPTNTAA